MKFVTVRHHVKCFVGLVDKSDTYVIDVRNVWREKDLPYTLTACLELGEEFVEVGKTILREFENGDVIGNHVYLLEEVELIAPIPTPRKNIFCVGKNYRDHILEMGSANDIPEDIIIFTKAPTAVIGTNGVVNSHKNVTTALDYEGELAIVIGKKGKEIKEEEALDYIFGYTIINDVTARDMQKKHKQFFLGKSLDTSCPMGPYLVHKDSLPNAQQLQIETKVNGEVRQSANTEMMIFSIAQIVSFLSRGITLEPGDIIATGTPAGVGSGFQPPKYLQSGDTVEVTIEGIGTLINTID